MAATILHRARNAVLNFVLPPRCAGCGDVVGTVGDFCAECWGKIDWLGSGCCERCAAPLEGGEHDICLPCEAKPPLIEKTRAAVRYDDLTRSLALKLKYGRRVGLAKVMGMAMARQVDTSDRPILVPVPLHRWRLWKRGFNQSALLAHEVGRRSNVEVVPDLLQRKRATVPMTNMSTSQRIRNVRGAMAMSPGADVEGRRVILVDDVRTSGATLEACARPLLKAGARRVEAILWARVVRPRDITRS
ncbi:ComF family protein [Sphingomicrobium clamense]|uniref:ComF family protein n=1 Tax=Sphingomicrobium clamense TaxID=2851013 RepID=A0ABS6V7F0_9SPHN|nr:ComF family protein [Sphingomicrobium sp. B8]MBW0145502.1 ComF family protein [Sphingomicrobium sp. B8]